MAMFCAFLGLQVLSTVPLLDLEHPADLAHAASFTVASLSVLIYCVIFYQSEKLESLIAARSSNKIDNISNQDSARLGILILISAAITLLYYEVVGYNLFLVAISGADVDFTTMRLASYAGESYRGAGIVNQFKNTILPLSVAAIVSWLYLSGKRYLSLFTCFSSSFVVLYCLLGSGQRAFLFFFIVIIWLAYMSERRSNMIAISALTLAAIPLFGMYSVLLNRAESTSFILALGEITKRVFVEQQLPSIVGFRYIYNLDVQYGKEWLENLAGMVPGLDGSNLANRVHAILYGSMRGTAPVSLWVSAFHNFGFMGVAATAIGFMAILNVAFALIVRTRRSPLSIILTAAMCLYGGLAVFSHPFQILNNGLAGLMLLYIVVPPRLAGWQPPHVLYPGVRNGI